MQQSLLSGFILGGTAGLFPLVCSGVIAIIHRPHMWFVDGTLNEYNYPLIDKESWVYGFYQQNQIALMLVTFVYVFILSGLFADIAVAVSFFTKKRYIEVIAPFVLVLALHIIVSNSTQISLYGLSHINFLKYGVAFTDRGPNELGAALTLPVLAGITAVLYSRKQAQDVL
ncbi:hypothetical protein KIMH_07860 [Bombiscardovia apis]|uniref:Uncharacterized protein n=1 Tax=Bombiscardovia apis TaxID=2932182 RepID=A0ABM8BCR5_9BIFI|nr:hypothetical protein KIMH_07860 [Bombiscardovia apis]